MRTTYFLYLFICLLATSVSGQNASTRQKISQLYASKSVDSLHQKLILEDKATTKQLHRYKSSLLNSGRARVVNDTVPYYLKRIDERGTAIYYATTDIVSRAISDVELAQTTAIGAQLQGDNMIVGVLDGQIILQNHEEFMHGKTSKVKVEDVSNDLKYTDQKLYTDLRAHATHVGGIIAAQGINVRSTGILPQAELWSYTWEKDELKMASLASQGILVSNHSYGIAAIDTNKKPLLPVEYFGTYTKDASLFDEIAYTFPFYQSVVAAGNDRRDYNILNPLKNGNDLLLGIANSKNSIVVGAIGLKPDNTLALGDFSSVGPTNDYRIKPDIVANGVNVFSSVYGTPASINSVDATSLYGVKSGTSMATPAVSGIIALWQQWALTRIDKPYRSATIRAITVHTATALNGTVGPSHMWGYGVINANSGITLLESALHKKALLVESTLFDSQTYTSELILDQDTDKLMFTLSWTDPSKPFSTSFFDENVFQPMLVNDLDIKVKSTEGVYYPWKLVYNSADILVEQGVNTVDNLEKVEIVNAKKGKYTIEITYKGKLKNNRQDFTLIASDQSFGGVNYKSMQKEDRDILVWPNPITDVLNIELPSDELISNGTVRVFSLDGKLIQQHSFSNSNYIVIPTATYQNGVYILMLESPTFKKTFKVVKK